MVEKAAAGNEHTCGIQNVGAYKHYVNEVE